MLLLVFHVADHIVGIAPKILLVILMPQVASIWISTELDALAPVGDSFSRVARVDDVAFIACGAMQRLVSVLRGTTGLSL